MPDDPDNLVANAIAALEPGILKKINAMPPEEQTIANGICLWLNGYSYKRAAAISGAAPTTLFERCKALATNSDREIKDHIDSIAPVYSQLSMEVARQQLEAVLDPDQKHSLAQLTVTGGVSTDKVIKFAELAAKSTNQPNQLADFFDNLAKRGVKRVSLEVETDDPTIDVTPSKD